MCTSGSNKRWIRNDMTNSELASLRDLVSFFFLTNPWQTLEKILLEQAEFSCGYRNGKPYRRLDFSANNQSCYKGIFPETPDFSEYIFEEMLSGNTFNGIGGYAEDRVIYRHRKHFTSDRKILEAFISGTDIWAEAGEATLCASRRHRT
jgi:hypothetical protein